MCPSIPPEQIALMQWLRHARPNAQLALQSGLAPPQVLALAQLAAAAGLVTLRPLALPNGEGLALTMLGAQL